MGRGFQDFRPAPVTKATKKGVPILKWHAKAPQTTLSGTESSVFEKC